MSAAIGQACRSTRRAARWCWTSAAARPRSRSSRSMASSTPTRCASAATSSMRRSSTVRRNYGTLIGEATAERVKKEIGSAYPGNEVRELGGQKAATSPRGAAQFHAELERDPRRRCRNRCRALLMPSRRRSNRPARTRRRRRRTRYRADRRRRAAERPRPPDRGRDRPAGDHRRGPLTCVARGGGRASN